MREAPTAYPASLMIDYPDRLDRLTTLLRIFTVIPIAFILGLLTRPGYEGAGHQYGSIGFLFLPVLLLILFRRKYPRWWFDWNLALTRFAVRVTAYLALLRDEYPSTDEEQAAHVGIPYPDVAAELNRWLPLVKWFLAIPHFVLLAFLYVAVVVVTIVAWFAILFTGRYPRGLFDFVVGVLRWTLRVQAYALLLTTDRYPPFRLAQ